MDRRQRERRFQRLVASLEQARRFAQHSKVTYYVIERVDQYDSTSPFYCVLDLRKYPGRHWKIIAEVKPDGPE